MPQTVTITFSDDDVALLNWMAQRQAELSLDPNAVPVSVEELVKTQIENLLDQQRQMQATALLNSINTAMAAASQSVRQATQEALGAMAAAKEPDQLTALQEMKAKLESTIPPQAPA